MISAKRFAQFLLALPLLTVLSFGSSTALADELKIVPSIEVCMVNDTHFGRPQIPVAVAEKTYYGCCENCKTTLSTNTTARMGVDPVTKKPVDKATAVIAAKADGSVLYFESENSLKLFKSKSGQKSKVQ